MFYGNETVSLSNNGFYSMDEFLRTLHSGRADNRLINASMVEGIPEFGGYSVPEEYGAFLMDKSWRMKSSVPEQQYGQWEAKQRRVPAFDGADRTNHLFGGIFRRMAGGRSDRHTKDRQAKTDPIKGQEACLLLTGIQ